MIKLPKGLYWRNEVIWTRFKLKGRPRVRKSTETANVDNAVRFMDNERDRAYEAKYWNKEQPTTVGEMIDRFLSVLKRRKKKLKSIKSVECRLLVVKEYVGSLPNDQLKEEHMVKLVENIWEKKRGPRKVKVGATVNRYMSSFKSVYISWNKNRDEQIRNPVKAFYSFEKENPRERLLTDIERADLIKASNKRIRRLCLAAMWTGMREGELLKIRWSDIDFAKHAINIRKEITKDDEARSVPMFRDPGKPGTNLEKMFFEMWLERKGDFVFGKADGTPAEWSYYRKDFERAVDFARIEDFTFRDWRHSFVADHIMAGTDLKTIATYVGHASTAMIERVYGRIGKASIHLHERMQKLSTLEEMWHKSGTMEKTAVDGNPES